MWGPTKAPCFFAEQQKESYLLVQLQVQLQQQQHPAAATIPFPADFLESLLIFIVNRFFS